MSFDYATIPAGYYFDAMLNGTAPQRFWHYHKFLKVVELIPDNASSVLDIGCAAGGFSYVASIHRPGLSITGVDISRDQIDYANLSVLPLIKNGRFSLIQNSYLPFADQSFDVVTTIELIEHLPDKDISFLSSEIHRVLRPSGIWLITTPNYHSLWPLIEILLNIFSPVKYNEQHLTKFHKAKLKQTLLNKGDWNLSLFSSFFFLSPFLSWISPQLAEMLFRLEIYLKVPGNLLLAAASPKARLQKIP